ncbi:MAG: S8 family serine peptidase, partial [bacterium]
SVDNSPIANAAVRHGGHFLSVESIDLNGAASGFSDLGGSVSAPGECIRSTEAIDARNYDDTNGDMAADCVWGPPATWWDGAGSGNPVAQSYGTSSGTSFASPHAVGLVTALWALSPGLDFAEVRTLVTDAAYTAATTGGTRPRIDAFSAAMGIDQILGNKDLQKALVDVDDGTVDGNQRTVRDNSNLVTAQFTNITTTDQRRGDGVIDMSDFRAYRDGVVQAGLEDWDGDGQADLQQGRVSLDGDPNHPKKDLNADGCVVAQGYAGGSPNCAANGIKENIYPRTDPNSDGRMDPYKNFAFKDWPQPATDLEVLQDVWPASTSLTEGYMAADLTNLVPNLQNAAAGSGDVGFRLDPAISFGPTGTYDELRISITALGGPRTRSIMAPANSLLWTLPYDQALPISVEGYKNNALVGSLCTNAGSDISPLLHAEDRVVLIQTCGPIQTSMAFDHDAHDGVQSIYTDTVNRNKSCPDLAPGQSCRLMDRDAKAYTWTEYDLLITRNGTSEYTITGYATSHADPPPLGAATGHATSSAHGAIFIRIPIPAAVPGMNKVTMDCNLRGDVKLGPPEEPILDYVAEGITINPPFERPPECFWGTGGPLTPPQWALNSSAVLSLNILFFPATILLDFVLSPDAKAGRGVDYPAPGKNYSFSMENRLDFFNLHVVITPS